MLYTQAHTEFAVALKRFWVTPGLPSIWALSSFPSNTIHPLLSVKQGDLETAKKLAIKLKNDNDFYNECSKLAVENYTTKFSEEIFLQKMNERLISC